MELAHSTVLTPVLSDFLMFFQKFRFLDFELKRVGVLPKEKYLSCEIKDVSEASYSPAIRFLNIRS
jgi:hypothetical protein